MEVVDLGSVAKSREMVSKAPQTDPPEKPFLQSLRDPGNVFFGYEEEDRPRVRWLECTAPRPFTGGTTLERVRIEEPSVGDLARRDGPAARERTDPRLVQPQPFRGFRRSHKPQSVDHD